MKNLMGGTVVMLAIFCLGTLSVNSYAAEICFEEPLKFADQKTKISETDLPDEVRASFQESEYGQWEIIDVYQEEGEGEDLDIYYEINVKGNNEENVSLLYDANGRLVETR